MSKRGIKAWKAKAESFRISPEMRAEQFALLHRLYDHVELLKAPPPPPEHKRGRRW